MSLRRPFYSCVILLAFLPPSTHEQKNGKRLIHECFGYDWPKNEVPWIITDEERAAFYKLRNDEERNQFVEQFWDRRDPTPKTLENEFRDIYYERVLYANQHFGVGTNPGWLTPQGRIYVMYGAPDSIEQKTGNPGNPETVALAKSCSEAKPFVGTYELWRFQPVASVNHSFAISFADLCGTGEPLAVVDQADSTWLDHSAVPKYKLECNGKYDPNKPPDGPVMINCLGEPPKVQLKDLADIVSHRIDFRALPFQVGYAFEPVTSRTVAWTVTLTFSHSTLKWATLEGARKAHVQLYGRVTTLTGRIARSFERDVTFDDKANAALKIEIPLYELSGLYRLDLAVKDVAGDVVGTYSNAVRIPDLGTWCNEFSLHDGEHFSRPH